MKVTMESRDTPFAEEFKTGTLYVHDQNDSKFVVLVTGNGAGSSFSGTVVASNSTLKPVGYISTGWTRHAFKPFHGRITMEA